MPITTTHADPQARTQRTRETARQALAKLLAQSLFNEWLQKQVDAGLIPSGEQSTPAQEP
jgi:hypothetical protein